MSVTVVLADPPREGLALPELVETSPLSAADAADLYAALLKDTFLAVDRSGGDLLVNYRPDDQLAAEHRTDTSSEAALRALVADALGTTDGVRFEVQVGSTFAARAGNAVTHLLRDEDVLSVAVTRGLSPFLTRVVVDEATMKLRTNQTVIGPSTDGRTFFAGFTEPIDFTEAFTQPEVETLANRSRDSGNAVEFIGVQPVVERGRDLATVLPLLWSRVAAERIVPKYTATFAREKGLDVVYEDGRPRVVVGDE